MPLTYQNYIILKSNFFSVRYKVEVYRKIKEKNREIMSKEEIRQNIGKRTREK